MSSLRVLHPMNSKTLPEAKKHVVAVYRQIARTLPRILLDYKLEQITPQAALRRIGDQFRANGDLTDPKLIDFLRYKAEVEVDESVRQFKTSHHILAYVSPDPFKVYQKPGDPKHSPFLQQFLKNQVPTG